MNLINKDCRSLDNWLDYLENIDPSRIELGLERIGRVAVALGLNDFRDKKVVSVAGTNGKGSTCAFIADVLNKSGYSVGLYTSPHLLEFTERIVIDGTKVDSTLLCEAFGEILSVSSNLNISLTYFEFTTLAALYCFKKAGADVLVLEVGLGGRLDAVNIIDADIAVISSIGLDHVHILGDSIDRIAYEKGGIIKEGCICVLGEVETAAFNVIADICRKKNAMLVASGRLFAVNYVSGHDTFSYTLREDMQSGCAICVNESYSLPKIPFKCVGIAISVLKYLEKAGLHIKSDAVNYALLHTSLPCRMQQVMQKPDVYIDVAHNGQAAEHLCMTLSLKPAVRGRRRAVVAMLKDKDIESVIKSVHMLFDNWYVASTTGVRGEDFTRLEKSILSYTIDEQCVHGFNNIETAVDMALKDADCDDEIVIFGSFVTASAALRYFNNKKMPQE